MANRRAPDTMEQSVKAPLWRLARRGIVAAACMAVVSCETVEQDAFEYQNGNSPDPAAMIEGAVTYSGPRPECELKADGSVGKIKGNVILTLFEYDNPPAPEGTATSSLNLLVISGSELFLEADCFLPPEQRLARSVEFVWPRIILEPASTSYQIRGFFDRDDDFIPFFSVTRIPTAGDVVGAALQDIKDPGAGLFRIELPSREAAPNGYLHEGVTVVLGEQVWSERPAFRLDENRRLSANAPFIPELGAAALRSFRRLTCAAGPGTPDCGLTLARLGGPEDAMKLAGAGVELALDDPARYAFYAEPVDVTTVVPNGLDLRAPDGIVDPHPFLNGLGINWYTPMLIMQRSQSPYEVKFKIPRVLMVGSVLLDEQTGKPTKQSYTTALPMSVAPVAALELKANDARCRVPYFAPGTPELVLSNRVAHCAELPTGRYAVNVLAGLAGGTVVPSDDLATHESGVAVTGARYSGQSWSIPNELGQPEQVAPQNLISHQGMEGMFVIHDPTPQEVGACTQGTLFGQCPGEYEITDNAVDTAKCLPSYCCAEIAHLYERPLPRCEVGSDGISLAPTMEVGIGVNGQPIPDCLPFELPWQCRP